MSMIGIFWVHDGEVLGRARPLAEGRENVSGILDSPDSHVTLWERDKSFVKPAVLAGTDYQSVPRGRALYDTRKQRLVVYMDGTLFKPTIQAKIARFFATDKKQVTWATDIHYTTNPLDLDDLFDD